MFKEHRELQQFCHEQALKLAEIKAQAEAIATRNLILEEDNRKMAAGLEQAQTYINSNPSYVQNVMDLMEKYQREVLQELPLAPDQQPHWLSPGDDIPIKED